MSEVGALVAAVRRELQANIFDMGPRLVLREHAEGVRHGYLATPGLEPGIDPDRAPINYPFQMKPQRDLLLRAGASELQVELIRDVGMRVVLIEIPSAPQRRWMIGRRSQTPPQQILCGFAAPFLTSGDPLAFTQTSVSTLALAAQITPERLPEELQEALAEAQEINASNVRLHRFLTGFLRGWRKR